MAGQLSLAASHGAAMLEQLRLPEGGSVLEIGAGTGYNAALLSGLVGASGRVVTVDIDPEVAEEARSHLGVAGAANVEVICGDGAQGWPGDAPYDGIIVTAGASDLAPAWASQLAPSGRQVVPLSIRGVQQLPVPGHPSVYLQATAGTDMDAALVADVLRPHGPAADTGVTVRSGDVFASLRPWLAFREPALATLTYSGPPDAAEASGVPAVIDFTVRGVTRRASPCLPGPAGLAALDFSGPGVTSCDPAHGRMLRPDYPWLRRSPAAASQAQGTDRGLDAAGRPGPGHLRIDAYPAGVPYPGSGGIVHVTPHATFVISSSRA